MNRNVRQATARLSVLTAQVTSATPESQRAERCCVALWGRGGGFDEAAEALAPICEELGVELRTFSLACSAAFPQFPTDELKAVAATLTDKQRTDAEVELREVCKTATVWMGWPHMSWREVLKVIGGWPEQLKWIQTISAGADELLKDVPQRIGVYRAVGKFDEAIAEWVVAWMFMHAKNSYGFLRAQHEQKWQPMRTGISKVTGSCVLCVGLGSIATRLAKICKSLGVKVIGITRSATEVVTTDVATIYPSSDLQSLLPQADYVVISLPLTPETRLSFGANEVNAMKQGAALINIARGDLVDWPAICSALREKRLAACYTDVITPEPLPDEHEYWRVPNLFITPHCSFQPHPPFVEDANRFSENLRRYLNGQPMMGFVDRAKGY